MLAIDPAGAEALDLLKTSGSEAMYVFTPGQAAPAPWGLQMRVWKRAGTAILDADAFGRLYVARSSCARSSRTPTPRTGKP